MATTFRVSQKAVSKAPFPKHQKVRLLNLRCADPRPPALFSSQVLDHKQPAVRGLLRSPCSGYLQWLSRARLPATNHPRPELTTLDPELWRLKLKAKQSASKQGGAESRAAMIRLYSI